MSNADTHRELHDLFNGRDFDGLVKRMADGAVFKDQGRGLNDDDGNVTGGAIYYDQVTLLTQTGNLPPME